MGISYELEKLCEAWWKALANASKDDQRRHAEQFLSVLGWSSPIAVETEARAASCSPISYVLGGEAHHMAAFFVMPGGLKPPSAVVERHLDFCETTRLVVDVCGQMGIPYVLVTDLFRAYLYDVATDELLLYADTPTDFNRVFGEILTRPAVQQGELDELRRQPRSYLARQLREWGQRWCDVIWEKSGASREDASVIVDRLFVLQYLFTRDRDILRRAGWQLRRRYCDVRTLAKSSAPAGTGAKLNRFFTDIYLHWKAELFAPVRVLAEALDNDAIAVPLLRELDLLTKSMFAPGTILESFNDGEAAEKARVRMIPEEDEERRMYINTRSLDDLNDIKIEVDVVDEGYRAVVFWFDRLVQLFTRLETEFEVASEYQASSEGDLDLFAWSEQNALKPRALVEPYCYIFEHAFVCYCATERQYRTARLMLYLHLIGLYAKGRRPIADFPPVEKALRERPLVLASDRKQIYQPSYSEW
jgi:hypothetical protein